MIKKPEQIIQEQVNPSKPRGGFGGLLDYAKTRNNYTGLSRMQNFAAALDPLIMPEMRAGEAIRERGAQRVAAGNKNKTIEMLIARNRQDLADMVQSGAITPGEAVNYMMQEASADKQYGRELELASSRFNKTPTSFAALDMQARAGGLIPKSEGGDGSYEKWMMESGKGAAAAGKIDAKTLAENREAFTKQITNYTTASRLINEISNDPNLANVTGKIQGLIKADTPAGLVAFDGEQINLIKTIDNLQNSVFLEAFQSLKGGGQITELEGEKAQAAIVNLSRQRTTEGFLKALQDYQSVLDIGISRAKEGITVPVSERYTGQLDFSNIGGGSKSKSDTKNVDFSKMTDEQLEQYIADNEIK